MKRLRTTTLYFQEGNSDKVYQVELCEYSSTNHERYVVNFRYGRRGGSLRESTKTTFPVSLDEAQEIFASLVVNKQNKGYREAGAPGPEATTQEPSNAVIPGLDTTELWYRRLEAALQHPDEAARTRAIWRIGEIGLRRCNELLLSLAQSGTANQTYCVAWALGRLGQEESAPLLAELGAHQDERVRRIAAEARLLCLTKPQRQSALQTIIQSLPSNLQGPWPSGEEIELAERIRAALGVNGEQATLLEALYQVALSSPALHRSLQQLLTKLPMQPNFFRAVRHLYKAAELRLDGSMLGAISYRIESSKAFYTSDYVYLPSARKFVRVAEELKKPDSRIAFSQATKDYFRRRSWRICRRLGEIDDDRYIEVALGILDAITDADMTAAFHREQYRWSRESGRYRREKVASHHYDEFAGFVAFNQILHRNSPHYRLTPGGRAWERLDAAANEARSEAYPEIWDRHPDALLRLLKVSRCHPVHRFAARALRDHPEYCANIQIDDLAELLQSAYAETQAFALHLAHQRLDPQEPDWDLLLALLSCPLDTAFPLAREFLAAVHTPPADDVLAKLWCLLVTLPNPQLRAWAQDQRPWISDLRVDKLVPYLQSRIAAMTETEAMAVIDSVLWLLCDALQTDSAGLDLNLVESCLLASQSAIQLIGAALLRINRIPLDQIPPLFFHRIQESQSASVRAVGIHLLEKLSDSQLCEKAEVITESVIAGEPEIREACLPLVVRLLACKPDYGDTLLQAILATLFQSEVREGTHAALLEVVQNQLAEATQKLDSGTLWRLLQARSSGARRCGEILLQTRNATDWSLRQWAKLGAHPTLAVRAWVWQAYRDHEALIKSDKANALRLLSSSWEDTQDFALDYFRNRFSEADWTPELLVHLVDHVEESIQQLGRELISRFFQADSGPEYLIKLSQHPSTQVQLFASHFLHDFASGHRDRILGLRHYFLTVLSQINRGRVAKDRVLQFLAEQSRNDVVVAELTNELLARVSATAAIQDKARFLQILVSLKQQYPDLSSPMQLIPLDINRGRSEVSHGI